MLHAYVTPAEFRTWPTFLDSQNLRLGENQQAQDAALEDILLTASDWADVEVAMPLAAHVRVEQTTMRTSRDGRLRYHPQHAPVLEVSEVATGPSPDALSAPGASVWIEQDGRIITATLGGGAGSLSGLQFGTAPAAAEMLVRWTYTAGYPCTRLATAASSGATQISVLDATGISAGTVLRLWTPGVEQAVTVTAVAGTTLTLAGGLDAAHPEGATCSALPPSVRLAVMKFAMAKLLRVGPNAASAGRSGSGPAPSSTSGDAKRSGAHSGYVDGARSLLATFKRVR